VSGAGDIDKDGYDDVLVGAPGENGGGVDNGRAYVYHYNDSLLDVLNTSIMLGATTIWKSRAPLNASPHTAEFTQALNDHLRKAAPDGTDEFGISYVNVPLNLSMQAAGNLTLFNLSIEYDYNATTRDFAAVFNTYLAAHQGDMDAQGNIHIPVKVTSSCAGRVRLSGLSLTPDQPPSLVNEIGTLQMDEDNASLRFLDLHKYFQDDVDSAKNLNFSLVSSTNSSMVHLWISGNQYLSVDAMSGESNDNWTGTVESVVACTDSRGHTTQSNKFTI
jgi:hypothetical protein